MVLRTDQAYEAEHPGKLTCQILAMAKYEWFEKWEEESAGDRGEEYNKMKDKWKKLCLDGLFRFYPQLEVQPGDDLVCVQCAAMLRTRVCVFVHAPACSWLSYAASSCGCRSGRFAAPQHPRR